MPTPEDLQARRLAREIHAREQAEALLEQKSRELFEQARERERAVAALRESEERYRQIVELSPDAILIEAAGKIVFANSAARVLYGDTGGDALLGRSITDLVAPLYRQKVEMDMRRLHAGEFCEETEELAVRLDGSTFEVSVQRVALPYGGAHGVQMIARDISTRKRLESQLAYQATHDMLTGTVTRARIVELLQDALHYAKRYHQPVWVGFIDLDRFKYINDRYGHRVGDRVLVEFTRRVRQVLRATDAIGRFGGDEFIVVLRGGNGDRDFAHSFIERIAEAVKAPMVLDGQYMHLTFSLGLAAYPQDGEDATTLIERADTAMYRAKEMGRNICLAYSAEMHEQRLERARIESALYSVLEREELFLEYQPQVDLRSGRIVGVEALLRMQHPELGRIGPERFITIAEECGMITRIGAWVMQQACRQCAEWLARGLGPLRMAVNLSARQLSPDELIGTIKASLAMSGLPPTALEIELTETLMMADIERSQQVLQQLRAMEVMIAVDDFGTGYSSLAYLRRLPLDSIKIDKSFVSGMEGDEDSQVIVSTLIQLARHLNLRVIAEGVETPFQLDFLREQGCHEVQGFLLSKPLPAAEVESLLQEQAAKQRGAA